MSATLPTKPIEQSPILRKIGADLLPTTLQETLQETWIGAREPTRLLSTQIDIMRESGSARDMMLGDMILDQGEERETLSPVVDPDELNEEFGHLGLSFKEPTRRRVAEILAEQKREELRAQSVMRRGPSGILATGAQFGVGLIRSMIDPINAASAFVPVVGQARFAGMVARHGLTRARLATGAIEGFAGAVAIEPLVAGLATQQQLDYRMSDSLMNVAFGTLAGGGLHLAAGKVGDMIRARGEPAATINRFEASSPAVREAAMVKGVSDALEGRVIDVEPAIQAARYSEFNIDGPSTRQGTEREFARIRRAAVGEPVKEPLDIVEFIRREGGIKETADYRGDLASLDFDKTTRGKKRLLNEKGLDINEARERAEQAEYLPEGTTPRELIDALAETAAGRPVYSVRDIGDAENFRVFREAESQFDEYAAQFESDGDLISSERAALAARSMGDAIEGEYADVRRSVLEALEPEEVYQPQGVPRTLEDLNRLSDEMLGSPDSLADPDASIEADNLVRAFEDDNLDNAVEFDNEAIGEMRRRGELTKAEEAELAEADEFVKQAESGSRAIDAAANCLIVNGA